ncbi:MAG: heme-binding domain-containing protein [Myxococcales bacterium]
MSRSLKAAFLVAALVLAAQAIRPERTNPPEDRSLTLVAQRTVEPEVAALLDRACADCHTHRTRWPWYSEVAPASWLLAHDVEEGRGELNLSEWGRYPPDRQHKLLGEVCEDVESGEMPPAAYRFLHPEARLATEEARRLCEWARAAPRAPTP